MVTDTGVNAKEMDVIKTCLIAAVDGPFFPDPEFSTIFGLHRDEVRHVLAKWPDLDWSSTVVKLAVNNSINNLLGCPHGVADEWDKYISIRPVELEALFDKLLSSGMLRHGETS